MEALTALLPPPDCTVLGVDGVIGLDVGDSAGSDVLAGVSTSEVLGALVGMSVGVASCSPTARRGKL